MKIENFTYVFAGKLKRMKIEPAKTETVDGETVTTFKVTCPTSREFVCSFDTIEAAKKKSPPKKK